MPSKLFTYVLMIAVTVGVLVGCGESGGTDTASGGDLQLSLSTRPDPPEAGPVTLVVEVKDSQGNPVDNARVTVAADMVGMRHAGLEGEMVSTGSGKYEASGVLIMGGTWRVQIDASREGTAPKSETFHIEVR